MSIKFTNWNNGIKPFIESETGCKPFSGAGINIRSQKKTALLKSVDNTAYYDDNLDDINKIEYTLYGQVGDQNEDEPKFNKPLLDIQKTKHIYVYRVIPKIKEKYIWYGKYKITGKKTKIHKDKNNNDREIIILILEKIKE